MRPLIVLMLLYCFCISIGRTREITHEDIKDAMLSLVHMMRENTEKLERHEARERQLGEQLKKTITILTKRVSAVDGLKLQLNKLDERISGLEHLFTQRDERERIQMQKTMDSLEDLESRLEGWFTDIENKVAEINSRSETTSNNNFTDILNKLNNIENNSIEGIARLKKDLHNNGEKMNKELITLMEKAHTIFLEMQDVASRIEDIENFLEKIRQLMQTIQEKPSERQMDLAPTLDEHIRTLVRVQELIQNSSDRLHELPRINEVQALHNETQAMLQETKHALKDVVTRGINNIEDKITETKEETKDSVAALRMDLANNAERVNQELQDLEKSQSVMVSMADHVLDTKKRVEYGVHQILLEVGDLVKAQGININNTLSQRFDGISNDIMDNQNGALANLTSKMEQEMNKVWRQINVMYQQMSESARALDKLHQQNEVYVNGTTSTMGGMESKVGEITKRMTEVDENLNYLLGRLSLVTQEFNQIKTGLGKALDNIKASFKVVQEKALDLTHPGPHPLPENYKNPNESETRKPEGKPLSDLESHIFNIPSN
ncbi:centromere-associated protein E isoform X1 [Cataglyphis hispanica]|uniref:centromere-associated protein E isoform X1 n=1 Tax=Cataglyphis hispanica TaxID=1086592 RepID=UPI0021808379|nr:centromere-associated protein E isoform X1 [Cataglyphis hispanica]XP_050461289.1 centromere-associated protein E isoform X1 [Cataglyphis hispanica]XP_050461290.1 centromere-associated protein E isoform X1 [Cataglyphis hispanica]XP_050461291.1 centromere-associated protein E isoform X1 [Cataglyphis hispanica]XP_050461292.1 centromere-associated protein E isoform X1 [Cataglyphis hispanica]